MGQIAWVWWLIVHLASGGMTNGETYGGRFAAEGEFPYVVFLLDRGNGSGPAACAGMIASLSQIISAAHCFTNEHGEANDVTRYTVMGGVLKNAGLSTNRQQRKVVKFKIPNDFGTKRVKDHYHDIAIAQLDQPFNETKTLSPMNLASTVEQDNKKAWDKFVESGKLCVGVGWADPRSRRPEMILIETLRAMDLKPWTDDRCRQENDEVDDDMTGKGEVCLSLIQNQTDKAFCHAIAGVPLICNNYIFGLSRTLIICENDPQNFILLWPYLQYFELGVSISKSSVTFKFTSLLLGSTAILLPLL